MKPVLVVMAAGLGSRYGGLKQLEPISDQGQLLIDYSLYDAKRAGFEKVVFVIRPEMEEAFEETIGARVKGQLEVVYAYQSLEDVPEGVIVPAQRSKPWGTAHAAMACRHVVQGPFAIINADDFYGAEGFRAVYEFLEKEDTNFGLVGYALSNTVTEHGFVSRGICSVDAQGKLEQIVERTHIEAGESCPIFTEDGGESWEELPGDTIVSMNLWGFQQSYLEEAQRQWVAFHQDQENILKREFFLPTVADTMVRQGQVQVQVLPCSDSWYGVTYPQDRPCVMEAIAAMTQAGKYPSSLWQEKK